MAQAAREPDALDMWFTRQRRLWWKKWRWVVVAAITLRVLLLLADSATFAVIVFYEEISTAFWYPYVRDISSALAIPEQYAMYVFLAIAVLVGSAESKVVIPLAEFAITQSAQKVAFRIAKFSRQRIWLWVHLLFTLPGTVVLMLLGSFMAHMGSDIWVPLLLEILILASVGCFVAEFQSYLLRETITTRYLTWLQLIPVLVAPVAAQLDSLLLLLYVRSIYGVGAMVFIPYLLWYKAGNSLLLLVAACLFAFSRRQPPTGFRGTYED
jgi:hypothetical protein